MKRSFHTFIIIPLLMMLTSCGYQVPLEDTTIVFILGIDLDENNNLVFYESSPVFNKGAKVQTETYHTKADTIRDSKKYFDAVESGEVTGAKIQILLLGKKVVEHENWFPILDTLYRNSTFSLNTRVVVVDGQVSEVINYQPKSNAYLVMYLKNVIDKNHKRTRTEKGTLQQLHSEFYDKGVTPALSNVKKGERVEVIGNVLLDNSGKYVDSLNLSESTLFLFLKHNQKHPISYTTITIPTDNKDGIFNKHDLSFEVTDVKSKIKTSHEMAKFTFDVKVSMTIFILESLLSMDIKTNEAKIKEIIEHRLKTEYEKLFKKIQSHKIDPIGFGIYARAYEYEHFKKVEDNWTEALSQADINVSVEIEIKGIGTVNETSK
ncbi:Ger(x)C family spore germination protein [Fredinandcohnia sp. QZ13]|uniref:Ger(x)C family spore germination protein n=1 Tax=Fredinandcohnia sp. QZ13 TaxID=3073144 RepID=UPI002853409E|nr:Ger(x)C family spore germination protein [Fredinandcohnia sp. QZ13]MDR4889902.1 Ger(x)C family spore germination protein [Fredinandcohnia sp. QZ13]